MINKLIIISLFFLGAFLTLINIYTHEKHLTTFVYQVNTENTHFKETVKSNQISGTFVAQANYLGGVNVNFNLEESFFNNTLVFTLKEGRDGNIYYTSKHQITSVNFVPYFPIGFPPIKDSKNKKYSYTFEVYKDSLIMSKNDTDLQITSLAAKHQFPKALLLSDNNLTFELIYYKVKYIFLNNNIIVLSYAFLLPIIYVLVRKYLQILDRNLVLPTIVLFVILIDIFLINSIHDLTFYILFLIWFGLFLYNKIDYRINYLTSLICLIILIITRIFNLTIAAEKAGAWAYLFMFTGTILLIIQYRFKIKPSVTMEKMRSKNQDK